MTRLALSLLLALVALAAPRRAFAEDDEEETVVSPENFDPSACGRTVPSPNVTSADPPVTWSGFEIQGQVTESESTLRGLFEPTMRRHRAMTDSARGDITKIASSFGYHLVGLGTKNSPQGIIAVITLSPLPLVRRIDVDVKQGFFEKFTTPLFEEEIKRRLRVRVGSYLPWTPKERACDVFDEQRRVEEYLRDEGYFEAKVSTSQKKSGRAVTLLLRVGLGPRYEVDAKQIKVAKRDDTANVTDDQIRETFQHRSCYFKKICVGTKRFNRTDQQADVQSVVEKFHKAGYPAVRVRTDFDPLTSFDRRSKKVRFTVTIDARRKLDVYFEYDRNVAKEEELRAQLTFNQAASSDDVEANESAKALTAFLQTKGYFEARVTFSRERFDPYDRITFRIDAGKIRDVQSVAFVGNKALDEEQLRDVIGTRESRFRARLFGDSTRATSAQLARDVDALVSLYKREGYREARVRVDAAPSPEGLGSAALTAALVGVDRASDVFVRFSITEGPPTMLSEVHVALGDGGEAITTSPQQTLCTQALRDLAELLGEPQFALPSTPTTCAASAPSHKFKEDVVLDSRDQLKDRMFSHGRPRAKVSLETRPIGGNRVAAFYRLSDVQPLTVGKIVVRGNFRTTDGTIRKLLDIDEGDLLTKDALAEGARRLRNSGLFDAVNVAMPDLENVSEGSVNAVVEIAERYDYRAQLDLELGGSTYNGLFVTVNPAFKNLLGRGISLDLRGTVGVNYYRAVQGDLVLKQLAAEALLRFPQWLTKGWSPVEFQTEINGFHRRQDTPRFGVLTTDGVTLSLLRTWQRQRIGNRAARAITLGPHYDFRLRERPVDVLRPLGADDDQTQVPISTRTGSIGASFEWEQRTDRRGVLSPLAPEAGFRLEAQLSIASQYLGGQDTFLKASAAGTKYWPIGDSLVIRADARYDQGFPLGGAVLLPEVERYFAGGDSTVRGYEDDRLATEIIQVGVPPLGNVSQIRILPSGGNIRVMSSLDAQLRVWKLFATGVFVDAGLITNQWNTVTEDDIRPSVGMALLRIATPFGAFAIERAIPLRPQLGDNPRGRFHVSFAARAQF